MPVRFSLIAVKKGRGNAEKFIKASGVGFKKFAF
jgi:hypothetical protein